MEFFNKFFALTTKLLIIQLLLHSIHILLEVIEYYVIFYFIRIAI